MNHRCEWWEGSKRCQKIGYSKGFALVLCEKHWAEQERQEQEFLIREQQRKTGGQ